MKNLPFRKILHAILIAFVVSSCVPARQYEEMKSKRSQCEEELKQLKSGNKDLTVSNTEMLEKVDLMKRQCEGLKNDTAILGVTSRRLRDNYDQLSRTYNLLLEKNRELLEGSSTETRKVLAELQKTQEDLQKKEDALKKAEAEMNDKKKNLDELSNQLSESSKELNASKASMQEKEAKLRELQDILNMQAASVKALRESVSKALLGFENQGLTINIKNGKVYVSLDESLLFASGKFDVDAKGVAALKKLATVLEKDSTINVLIEGHTDNVPYKGAGQIKDNWDLSVMRATAIVKILLEGGKIAPERLSASGRSEYVPVDRADTKEAKAKNRRTEIILTPKLDKLFQIIESN